MRWQETVISPEKQNAIIDKALKENYRETMERKRVPTDYLLMFTEGGESNAVADAIARAQAEPSFKAGIQEVVNWYDSHEEFCGVEWGEQKRIWGV